MSNRKIEGVLNMTRHETFYKNARKVSTTDYDLMIEDYIKDAQESDYEWVDYNTRYEDLTLDCVLDYFSDVTEEDFNNLFGYSKPNQCYIVIDAGVIVFYAIITCG